MCEAEDAEVLIRGSCTRNRNTLAQRREGRHQWGMPSPCTYGPRHDTSETPSEEGHYPSHGSKAPHRRKMGWMPPEDGHIERVRASPTRRRKLALSITSPPHASSTEEGEFMLGQEGHIAAATRHPPATPDHKAPKVAPSRREQCRGRHRRPTRFGFSPRRPRGWGSGRISSYRCLQGGEWCPWASPSARPARDFAQSKSPPPPAPPDRGRQPRGAQSD